MKRSTFLVAICSTSLLLASVLYTHLAVSKPVEVTDESAQQAQIRKVGVIRATAATYRSEMNFYGSVSAKHSLKLRSQISAQVTWINPAFSNGALIRAGETLVTFVDTDYQAQLSSAKLALANANLALKIEQRRARQANSEFKRSGLKQQASALLMRKPQLAAANAQYRDAQASLKRAQYYLAQTTLSAPFDSVVSNLSITRGSFLNVAGDIAQLNDAAASQVTITLNPQQLALLPTDLTKVEVTLNTQLNPDIQWAARLTRLDSNLQGDSRLRRAVIEIINPLTGNTPLLNGSFVSITIKGRVIDNLFALPSSALSADGYIWTVEQSQLARAARRPVFSNAETIFIAKDSLNKQIEAVEFPLISFQPGIAVASQNYSKLKPLTNTGEAK